MSGVSKVLTGNVFL